MRSICHNPRRRAIKKVRNACHIAGGDAMSEADKETAPILRAILALGRRLRSARPEGAATLSAISLLGALARLGSMPATQLAVEERLQPQSLTRLVASLEKAGLIERRRSETDRRRVDHRPDQERQSGAGRRPRRRGLAGSGDGGGADRRGAFDIDRCRQCHVEASLSRRRETGVKESRQSDRVILRRGRRPAFAAAETAVPDLFGAGAKRPFWLP